MRCSFLSTITGICSIIVFAAISLPANPGPFGIIAPGSNVVPGPLISSNTLTFRWNVSAGAASYELYVRDVTDGPTGPLSIYPVNGTNKTLSMYPGLSYKWNV